jgi:hypothetical protein
LSQKVLLQIRGLFFKMDSQPKGMKTETKTQIAALVIFALLTLLHLHPLSFHPGDSVHDTGDPLLNSWIISSIQQSLISQPKKMFDGNIFFPSENTIAFSEHLFPQSVVSLPLSFLFGNPILIYNILFLFSYVLTAYAMFILVRYLTGDSHAGIVSGIIFAFSAYHLDHIPQLQLLSSGLFVFCFYYLLRYFKEKKTKYSLLFSTFFLLQALACIYYGLFLISVLVIVMPFLILCHRKDITGFFLFRLMFPLLAASAVLLAFSLPYISLLKFYGFSRGLSEGADLSNYFGVPRNNVVLGKILSPLGKPEGFFFPGILAYLFSGFFIVKKRKFSHHLPKILKCFFYTIIGTSLISVLAILATGGFSFNIGAIHISANGLLKPALLFFSAVTAFIFISFLYSLFKNQNGESENFSHFYFPIFVLLWALFLSFGKAFSFLGQVETRLPLPFTWFYKLVPGFSGIRAPSRYGIFVLFAVGMMAGFGTHLFFLKFKKQKMVYMALILVLILLNIEYLSIPQRIRSVPVKGDIPPTYRWIQEQPGDFALLEFPFFSRVGWESVYMYFSTFHGKKIVNGYSGFLPPSYFFLREAFDSFPSPSTIDILKYLDVKYLVVHTRMLNGQRTKTLIEDIENEFPDDLEIVKTFQYSFQKEWEHGDKFGNDIVFHITPDLQSEKNPETDDLVAVPATQLTISSNINRSLLPLLIDGRLETRWSTDRYKRTGDFLLVESSQPLDYPIVSLSLGPSANDFAIDFNIEISTDGSQWQRIEDGYLMSEFLEKLFKSPTDIVQKISIRQKDVRYIKLTQVGNSDRFWWSVAELEISQAQSGLNSILVPAIDLE